MLVTCNATTGSHTDVLSEAYTIKTLQTKTIYDHDHNVKQNTSSRTVVILTAPTNKRKRCR